MGNLNKVYNAYINHEFESSSGLTPDFAAFANSVKKALKKDCESVGLELVKFSRGHFDVTAFVRNPKKATLSLQNKSVWIVSFFLSILLNFYIIFL